MKKNETANGAEAINSATKTSWALNLTRTIITQRSYA